MFRLLQRHLHVLPHVTNGICIFIETYCDSFLYVLEADMSDGLFTSNVGSYAISSMEEIQLVQQV